MEQSYLYEVKLINSLETVASLHSQPLRCDSNIASASPIPAINSKAAGNDEVEERVLKYFSEKGVKQGFPHLVKEEYKSQKARKISL